MSQLPSDIWNEIIKVADIPSLKSLQSVSLAMQKAVDDSAEKKVETYFQDINQKMATLKAKAENWQKKYEHEFSSANETKVMSKLDAFDKSLAAVEVDVKKWPKVHADKAALRVKALRATLKKIKEEMAKLFAD